MFVHINPDSRLGKIILVISVPLFAALIVFQLVTFGRALRSYWWPTTSGVIVQSVLEKSKDMHGIPHSRAKIRYLYSVAGRALENDTVSFGVFRGMGTWGYAGRTVGRFPNGSMVTVHYDPSDPEVSCLDAGGLGWEDVAMFGLAIFGVVSGVKECRKAITRLLHRNANRQLPPRA